MLRRILPIFSFLCHPVLMSVLATVYYLLFYGGYLNVAGQLILMIQVLILTVLIPLLVLYLLRSLKKIDSFMIENLQQRRMPLLMQAILLLLLLQKSITIQYTPELYFFFTGAFLTTSMSLLATFVKFKASLHMAAMGALLLFIMGLGIHHAVNVIYPLAFWLILTGLVAASRLELLAHTHKELFGGFILGIVPQMILWQFWL